MRAVLSEIIGDELPMVSNTLVDIKSWRSYSELLKCDIFTVVSVDYNGQILSVFVDDEGLLKPNFGRMVGTYPEPLFGNIIVAGGVDDEGDTMDLPESVTLMQITDLISDMRYKTQ